MKSLRVFVSASDDLGEVRLAVMDLLVQLNRFFKPRGIEFVPALPTEGPADGDFAVALYWKDFGPLPPADFERVYEAFKETKSPKIYVFFKDPDTGITEALKAFKDSFEDRFGHFFCRFETVDSVKFQLTAQSLSLMPVSTTKDDLTTEGGAVRLGDELVAKLDGLPFAKLNAKRQWLLRQLEFVERQVELLVSERNLDSRDPGTEDILREARIQRNSIREQLAELEQNLFQRFLYFAKIPSNEMDGRVNRARVLFEGGRVGEASKVLDRGAIVEEDRKTLVAFASMPETKPMELTSIRRKNIQALVSGAEVAQSNTDWDGDIRFEKARESYLDALRIAREIRLDPRELASLYFKYARFLQQFGMSQECIEPYQRSMELHDGINAMYDKAMILNNLALAHKAVGQFKLAESELGEEIKLLEARANQEPSCFLDLADAQTNLGNVFIEQNKSVEAEEWLASAVVVLRSRIPDGCNERARKESLGRALNSLGAVRHDMNQCDAAENDYRDALRYRRELEEEFPGVYRRDVATTLLNWGVLLMENERWSEARPKYESALQLMQEAANEDPVRHEGRLALVLNNLANLDCAEEAYATAERRYDKAIELRRSIWKRSPESNGCAADLAQSLCNRANLYCETGRENAAERDYRFALELYGKIVQPQSAAYRDGMAMAWFNLALLHEEQGKKREALQEYRNSLENRMVLADAQPFYQFEVDRTERAISELLSKMEND